MLNTFGLAAMLDEQMAIIEKLTEEVVSARIRTRALLELLEEKGVLAKGEFDDRAFNVFERDYDSLAAELAPKPEMPTGFPFEALDSEKEAQSD